MKEYVVGLAFSANRSSLVLIQKKHGLRHLIGRWNGVGGHIEEGEQPIDAMVREFEEETGARIEAGNWDQFLVLDSHLDGFEMCRVYFFRAFTDRTMLCQTVEDEPVMAHFVKRLPETLYSRMRWVVPMALMELRRVYAVDEKGQA